MGEEAGYLGPQCNVTWGNHVSLIAGLDLPLRILNPGLQNVAVTGCTAVSVGACEPLRTPVAAPHVGVDT